ncbi:histidine phosphatase family protein [Rhodohalobacter sp. SW132]|uniref:histidine phosphatase family protein n=1 Tax=Rhodohalobacter sp. SW132 TaxID=2293433 RepID=UPI000E23C5AE|nr:histidine phosphatase family protein [Rhodohalobacter sp. SW132]REL37559.1 histidine phosphatase family protein [Rhodohalobacter sp. SW132]
MSLTRLFIIRHGETDFNRKQMLQGRGIDAPLNATGQKQALQIAAALEKEEVGKIVASSMMRSIQTAQPLASKLGMPIESFEDLDEMDFGDFEGKRKTEVLEEIERIHTEWASGNVSLKIPGGESPEEVFKRADSRIKTLLDGKDDSQVMILHSRLIRILLSEWLGYGLKNMHKIEHSNGAINLIIKNGTAIEAEYLNSIVHLT